jgi:hypothetical protein
VGQAKAQISESADLSSMSQDLQSLAELHPKRIVSSLAETPSPKPAPAATPADPPSAVDPNAT